MELKFIKLEKDHGLSDEQVNFLSLLDGALVRSDEQMAKKEDFAKIKEDMNKAMAELKNEFNYSEMQKQINTVFATIEAAKLNNLTPEGKEERVYIKNNQWLRTFLKKDWQGLKTFQIEQKEDIWPTHILHTGENVLIDDGSAVQGGHLIPELLEMKINKWLQDGSVARREMQYLPFSGAGSIRKHLFESAGVTVGWVDEGEIKPKTKPQVDYVNQTLKTIAAIVIMSEEIIEDSAIDLVAYCSRRIGEAIAFEEDVQFFAGIGAPWTGVINAAGIVPVAMPVTNVNASQIRPEDLLGMTTAVPSDAARGAKFYMHRTVLSALRAYRADAVAAGDGAGNYLVQDPTGATPGTMWGYPIVLSDALPDVPTVVAAGTPFMFFANLQRTSIYGDKKGLRFKLLDQATVTDAAGAQLNLAERDMFALRVHKRVGYVNILPSGIAVLETGAVS